MTEQQFKKFMLVEVFETKIKTLLRLKKASQLVGKSNVRSDEPEKP